MAHYLGLLVIVFGAVLSAGHVYAFEVAGFVMIAAIVDRGPVDEVEFYR